MPDEKDHLGEELRKRERSAEERYFAELSQKQLEKLRGANAAAQAAGFGKCPRCGAALEVVDLKGVPVDRCPSRHGMWLDEGEVEAITKRQGDSWLARLLLGSRG